MASARKNFTPRKNVVVDSAVYADFINRLGAGDITATRLIESRDSKNRLKVEYDDPNG